MNREPRISEHQLRAESGKLQGTQQKAGPRWKERETSAAKIIYIENWCWVLVRNGSDEDVSFGENRISRCFPRNVLYGYKISLMSAAWKSSKYADQLGLTCFPVPNYQMIGNYMLYGHQILEDLNVVQCALGVVCASVLQWTKSEWMRCATR
jgi:hypothetical protein